MTQGRGKDEEEAKEEESGGGKEGRMMGGQGSYPHD